MKKILVIEGDDAISQQLEATTKGLDLEFFSSVRLIPVHEIFKIKPDIILLEYRPPFGFGGDLCKELKTDPRTMGMKVILTSTDHHIAKIACDNLADGYLRKPFDKSQLVATLINLLQEPKQTVAKTSPKRSFWTVLGV